MTHLCCAHAQAAGLDGERRFIALAEYDGELIRVPVAAVS
jgi:hypothetical protein